jgi:hypothetical protein
MVQAFGARAAAGGSGVGSSMGGGGRREQVDEDEDEAPGPLKITTKGGARKVVQPNGGLAAFGDNRCAEPTL